MEENGDGSRLRKKEGKGDGKRYGGWLRKKEGKGDRKGYGSRLRMTEKDMKAG